MTKNSICSEIYGKVRRWHPLTDMQKATNQIKCKVRARVEHIFGAPVKIGGHIVRTIGLAGTKVSEGWDDRPGVKYEDAWSR